MANELPNAVALLKDDNFRQWVMAASVYQARQVIMEADTVTEHARRLQLANIVVANPALHLDKFVNIMACDPAIASVATIGTTMEAIGQPLILSTIQATWTPLAKVLFP